MLTRKQIENEIIRFVAEYDNKTTLGSIWRTPIVGIADAGNPDFSELRKLVHAEHQQPEDVLPGARTVIAYFVPFAEKVVTGNGCEGLSSPEWARAYEETNAMLAALGVHLSLFIASYGHRAAVSKEAAVFDREKITSRWSQRHIARLAGIGTFGLNNMLITQAGCCGRFGTIVSDLELEPDAPIQTEYCLNRRNGHCRVCIRNCPTGALSEDGFDRKVCYLRCLENAKQYTSFGSSYASKAGETVEDTGSEVCGKCLVNLPCSLKNP